MKFGIIGFGRMGKLYENVLKKLDIKIEFICDKINPNLTYSFYTDYVKALDNEDIDGLIISTYAPSHFEILNYALTKNIKFIACEKPFTVSVSTADSLAKKISPSNSRVAINYSRRFSKSYSKLYDILYGEKIVGTPKSIVISCGAGGISTIGTHFFDLCSFLLDEKIESLYSVAVDENLLNPRGPEFKDPGGYIVLNYTNSKRAFLDLGDDLGLQPLIEIICEYGRVYVNEISKTIQIYGRKQDDQKIPKHLYGTENIELVNETFNFETLDNLVEQMLLNLISNDSLIVTPEIATEKIQIYSAIRKSFETKNVVTLPLNDKYYDQEFAVT